jgi:hypothetical protein
MQSAAQRKWFYHETRHLAAEEAQRQPVILLRDA